MGRFVAWVEPMSEAVPAPEYCCVAPEYCIIQAPIEWTGATNDD